MILLLMSSISHSLPVIFDILKDPKHMIGPQIKSKWVPRFPTWVNLTTYLWSFEVKFCIQNTIFQCTPSFLLYFDLKKSKVRVSIGLQLPWGLKIMKRRKKVALKPPIWYTYTTIKILYSFLPCNPQICCWGEYARPPNHTQTYP